MFTYIRENPYFTNFRKGWVKELVAFFGRRGETVEEREWDGVGGGQMERFATFSKLSYSLKRDYKCLLKPNLNEFSGRLRHGSSVKN